MPQTATHAKSKRSKTKSKKHVSKVPKLPKVEMVPAARAEAAEYRRDVSAARVLELQTWIANTQKTGILDFTTAEQVLKGYTDPPTLQA